MNQFEMVALIVIVAVFGSIVRNWLRQRPKAEAADRRVVEENERMKREMAELKARIATLERIATDAPARLSNEIESLRDTKTN